MKWNKYTLKTRTEAEDIISSMMMDVGVEGIEIEDKVPLTEQDKAQMFVDIMPIVGEDDGTAYISFYLEPEQDQLKVGMLSEKMVHHHLVFFQGECAGGIDDISAWSQCGDGVGQDLFLPLCAVQNIVCAPFPDGDVVFAEHALAGTGGIYHNKVKGFRKCFSKPRRSHAGGCCVAETQPFYVSCQDFAA